MIALERISRVPLFLFIGFFGFFLRYQGIERLFWLDESTHNRLILESNSFFDLRSRIDYLFQPILEFALRKYFWFPIFGYQELGLRLPSLIVGMITLFLCIHFAFQKGRELQRPLAYALAIFLGAWCAIHPAEIHYSVEARHYSFVSLASLIWFWAYFHLEENRGWALFTAATLLFLNLHFFAYPIVVGALGLEIVKSIFYRSWRNLLKPVGIAMLTGVCIWLNYPAFALMFESPAIQAVPSVRPGPFLLILRAWSDFKGLGVYFFSPWIWGLAALILPLGLSSPVPRSRSMVFKWAFVLFFLIPILLLRVRTTSDYNFSDRYYMPFFGLAFFTLLLPLYLLAERVLLKPLARYIVPSVAGVAGFAMIGSADLIFPMHKIRGENFTALSYFYEEVKKRNSPAIVIASPCWGTDVPRFYWKYIGRSISGPVDFVDGIPYRECVLGNLSAGSPIGTRLEDFFRKNKTGIVLLHELGGTCPNAVKEKNVIVGKENPQNCLVAILDARSAGDIRDLAKRIGFPTEKNHLLKRGYE